jgi:hypothetical protein
MQNLDHKNVISVACALGSFCLRAVLSMTHKWILL